MIFKCGTHELWKCILMADRSNTCLIYRVWSHETSNGGSERHSPFGSNGRDRWRGKVVKSRCWAAAGRLLLSNPELRLRLQRAPYLPGIGVNHDWGAHRGYQCNESERYLKLCNSLIRDASSRQDPIQLRSIDPCFPQIDFFYYFVPFFVTFYSKFTYFWKLLHSSFASLIIHYLFSIKHHEGM